MPILIAFYQALLHLEYLEPSHAGFLWIANLSQPDRTLILPILTAASTYWQQKVSTINTQDQTQKYMLIFMPLFIGYLSYTFPAGLALYWVVFSVIGALQQMYVNHKTNKAKAKAEIEAGNKDTKSKDAKLESKTESKPVRKTKKGDRRKNAR
jgi:YidC/Oxa1 family membrane protein insertase